MTIRLNTFTRRAILAGIGGVTLASSAGALAAPSAAGGNKMVLVILRGAMDGLGAVPRISEDRLRDYRRDLVSNQSLDLSDGFALNPALKTLHQLYQSGDASILHAVAAPHRNRSHFLAQDLLETGTQGDIVEDGWLNRALQAAPVPLTAVSIGSTTPLVLRGKAAITSWSPPVLPEADDGTIARLMDMYANDEVLGPALLAATEIDEVAGDMMERQRGTPKDAILLSAAGRLLSAEDGPDIAVVALTGWDTHANQNGALGRRLGDLDAGLAALKTELGAAWNKTQIAVVTEFGRTVRQNGTRGTDHGTAGAAFLLGGAVKGGKILGDWPGLEEGQLYENRDLRPATDLRGLFKAVLAEQFGFGAQTLASHVFPDSLSAPVLAL